GRAETVAAATGAVRRPLGGGARDQLESALKGERQVGAHEVTDLRRQMHHRRGLKARRQRLVAVDLAVAAHPANAAAQAHGEQPARPRLRRLLLLLLWLLLWLLAVLSFLLLDGG